MTYFNNFHKNNEHPFFRVHKVPSAVRGNKTPPDSHRLHYPRPSDFKGSGVTHTHTHTCCQSVPGCITGASWRFSFRLHRAPCGRGTCRIEAVCQAGLMRRVQMIKIAPSNLTQAAHLCARTSASESIGVRARHHLFE